MYTAASSGDEQHAGLYHEAARQLGANHEGDGGVSTSPCNGVGGENQNKCEC